MNDPASEFHDKLLCAEARYSLASFCTRRLAALGAIYASVFGALLLLKASWGGAEEKTGKAVDASSTLDMGTFAPLMDFDVQIVIALVLLLSLVGWRWDGLLERVGGTLLVAVFVLPAMWFTGEMEAVIVMRFIHAVFLLACGLIADRTFGYTRAFARSRFYLERLAAISRKPAGNSKKEEEEKLIEAYAVDVYRDHVGDTFFTLDAIKAKIVGS
ncbi:hypothetical protein [Massilia niabensis]|uniref:Uncharacterized protein n=1 Tax=Massilia niabensis TaxID=544910 RepID=A0ABW0L4N5_9BURK